LGRGNTLSGEIEKPAPVNGGGFFSENPKRDGSGCQQAFTGRMVTVLGWREKRFAVSRLIL
jgi:hypothetical protein